MRKCGVRFYVVHFTDEGHYARLPHRNSYPVRDKDDAPLEAGELNAALTARHKPGARKPECYGAGVEREQPSRTCIRSERGDPYGDYHRCGARNRKEPPHGCRAKCITHHRCHYRREERSHAAKCRIGGKQQHHAPIK
eukprot:scaffold73117_cov31-Tisochrysis_lutea.AAC.3